jgi:hypothetical protein
MSMALKMRGMRDAHPASMELLMLMVRFLWASLSSLQAGMGMIMPMKMGLAEGVNGGPIVLGGSPLRWCASRTRWRRAPMSDPKDMIFALRAVTVGSINFLADPRRHAIWCFPIA